jgi:hypothetical protein
LVNFWAIKNSCIEVWVKRTSIKYLCQCLSGAIKPVKTARNNRFWLKLPTPCD